jgi:putative OPT family oligopeptide transporter
MSDFQPHVPAGKKIPEFTLRATLIGILFGLFFAVANSYLALKIGQTVSASIPAAVMSMSIFKIFFKRGTILENNIVQTVATVGEGLAAGVVFTIPALILLGETPSIGQIFLLSSLGGILGILFMIPMRRYLIVQEHKKLLFPEGTACAEILKAGEKSSGSALMAAWGILVAVLYKLCSNLLFIWEETPTFILRFLKGTKFSINGTPALLGVGYIIGPHIASIMFAGGITTWWILIPLIAQFGTGSSPIYPSAIPISQMSADEIWGSYVRYIGAGGLAVGGLYSLVKIAPLLYQAIRTSIEELFVGFRSQDHLPRTSRDIPMGWLIIGSFIIIFFMWALPTIPMNLFTVVLLVFLAFLFVAVTSLVVGIVGSTSNPVSGMVITTLFITCLIFVFLGWTERLYLISAMTMACVACCAITMAATTAQDLKTGFLLGATPRSQQVAEIIGVILPSLAIGYTIYILNEAYGIGSKEMPAPQATLMSMVVQGVIQGDLPYLLVGSGAILGFVLIILGIPVLPFALGLYLPLSLSTAIMAGGLVRGYVNHKSADEDVQRKGTLLASGLIGGDACIGVGLALGALMGTIPIEQPAILSDSFGFLAYFLLAAGLAFVILKRKR